MGRRCLLPVSEDPRLTLTPKLLLQAREAFKELGIDVKRLPKLALIPSEAMFLYCLLRYRPRHLRVWKKRHPKHTAAYKAFSRKKT